MVLPIGILIVPIAIVVVIVPKGLSLVFLNKVGFPLGFLSLWRVKDISPHDGHKMSIYGMVWADFLPHWLH